MEPTSNQPANGYGGNATTASTATSGSDQFSTTAAHATGAGTYPTDTTQPAGNGLQDTWQNALASGKQWLSDTGLLDQANQLPKAAKDAYDQVRSRVSGLSTTQVAVGVGLVAAAVAFLATRGRQRDTDDEDDDNNGSYRKRPRRSPFDHGHEAGQRPWGARRFGESRGDRVSSGSGYSSEPPAASWREERQPGRNWNNRGGQRRDQGPGRYDSRTSGRQNPNNLDDLSSAF